MKTEEAINFLKEKGYEIKEPETKFLKVEHSNIKNVLLENHKGHRLVETWIKKNTLNDFGWFEKNNRGHFHINGHINKFEFLYKNKWLKCNDYMPVRFLK